MKTCDTCVFFTKIKHWKDGRIGICESKDTSLNKIITQCKYHKSLKYKRKKGS